MKKDRQKTVKKSHSKQRLPAGWTEERIGELADYHDNLSEAEQAAEIEAALSQGGQTLMVVPTELVPEVRQLIAQKRTG